MSHQLAQVNLARAIAPLDSPQLAEFVAKLDEINALAEAAPGFVWRLKGDTGDATSIHAFNDDRILVNMSVWTTPDALYAYVYRSAHAEVMRRRREWFERMAGPSMAMWWVPVGRLPTLADAKARLEHLAAHGDTAFAFSPKRLFPAPGADGVTHCPAVPETPVPNGPRAR